MDVVASVLAALVAAYLLIALTPWGERLRFWSVTRFGSSGVAVHVELDPTNIPAQDDDDVTRLLFAQDFHFETLDSSALPDPPADQNSPTAWWSWGHQLGGKDVLRTGILVTIQALADAAVVVDPPHLAHRYTPSTSGTTLSTAGWGRGGGIVPRRYVFTLDKDGVEVTYQDELDRPRAFTLDKNDSERLLITVDVGSAGQYDWSIELPITANGKRSVLRIDDHGKPFTTFGWSTGTTYQWWGHEGWEERGT